jgi:ABC-type glycerol-3-phosphate transport system substrate-binding protein
MRLRGIQRLGVAAVCLAAAFVVVACGGGEDASEEGGTPEVAAKAAPEIDVVYAFDGLFSEPLKSTLGALGDQGITARLVLAGEDYEASAARAKQDIAAGNPPALTMVGADRWHEFAEAGRALPIDELIADEPEVAEQLYPAFRDLMKLDGKTYGFPYTVSVGVLYYNEDHFEQAGLDPERPPRTWDELRSAAQQLVDRKVARHAISWLWQAPNGYFFESQLLSNGGRLVDDAGRPAFNSPEGVEVVEHWRDAIAEGWMSEQGGIEDAIAEFVRGDSSMLVAGVSFLGTAREQAKFTVRTAPMPIAADGTPRAPVGGASLIITAADPAQRRAAWDALKLLVGVTGSTEVTATTGNVPVNQRAAESAPELRKALADRERAAGLEAVDGAAPPYNWPSPEQTDVLVNALFKAVRGGADPQAALDDAAEEIEQLR